MREKVKERVKENARRIGRVLIPLAAMALMLGLILVLGTIVAACSPIP